MTLPPEKTTKDPDVKSNLAIQYHFLAKLDTRIQSLSGEDTADTYNKFSSALSTAQKCCLEIEKAEQNMATQLHSTSGLSAKDRADKIAELCKLVSNLSLDDYDPAKLERRAAMIAADFNAKTGGGDDSPLS